MSEKDLFKNENENQEKKMFANKGANIAFGVVGGVIVLAIVGALIYAYVL